LRTLSPAWGFLAASLLVAASPGSRGIAAGADGPGPGDREPLLRYARDTWRSVAAMADGGALPVDGLLHQINGTWKPSPKTSPTDIACYLWSVLAAERLKIIDADESRRRLERALRAVERLDRLHGFFYDWIDPRTGAVLKESPYNRQPIPPIIPTVDNGWLAAALIMVRNVCPPLRDRAEALLRPMDFSFFYVPYDAADPTHHAGRIRSPYDAARGTFGGFDDLLNTEQRISSYIGIARGQLPPEHYYRLGRTLGPGEGRQDQQRQGEIRHYLGIPVFQGHYTYRGMRIVPSWGGSMFEALMVPLFVPEERWAPRSWGINHPLYVRAQIEHGREEAGRGFWGFSPACDPAGGYRTYGVPALGSDPGGYLSGDPAGPDRPAVSRAKGRVTVVVTPHASFLALRFAPREAMENLRKLRDRYPIYTEYGFLDSVDVSRGVVSDRILLLDQGMIMAAIANALADDAMRAAFVDDASERVLRPLMAPEEFTAGPAPPDGARVEPRSGHTD
jgi:hypothetical protein